MKIFTAIFTYERTALLKAMAETLRGTTHYESLRVNVFDDASHEYGERELRSIFPEAERIFVNKENMGADKNVRQAMLKMLNGDADCLALLDSDLIFNLNAFVFVNEYFQHTDGILSIYNSCLHGALSKVKIKGSFFSVKENVGAAGCFISRSNVENIVKHVPVSRRFDWDWSAYLISQGVRLLVSDESHVQHIGYDGYNANYYLPYEFGLNFTPDNPTTTKHFAIAMEGIVINENKHKNTWAGLADAVYYGKRFVRSRMSNLLGKKK